MFGVKIVTTKTQTTDAVRKEKMSFEDVRSARAIAHTGFLDDEEFLFLYNHYQPINPHLHCGIMIHFVWI